MTLPTFSSGTVPKARELILMLTPGQPLGCPPSIPEVASVPLSLHNALCHRHQLGVTAFCILISSSCPLLQTGVLQGHDILFISLQFPKYELNSRNLTSSLSSFTLCPQIISYPSLTSAFWHRKYSQPPLLVVFTRARRNGRVLLPELWLADARTMAGIVTG